MASDPLVLAVDDEPAVLRLMQLELEALSFRVITTSDPREALVRIDQQCPDVILLDVLMPEMDGLRLLDEIRGRWDTPVIFVSARGGATDKVQGLERGADDYLAKPFSADELSARIRAVLRRRGSVVENKRNKRLVTADGLEVDLDRRTVRRDGETIRLTRTEWMLLQYLAAQPGKAMLNADLLTDLWGPDFRDNLRHLRVWVARLRKKIERDRARPRIVETIPGVGYRFVTDDRSHCGGPTRGLKTAEWVSGPMPRVDSP